MKPFIALSNVNLPIFVPIAFMRSMFAKVEVNG